jgi:predicted ATPase/DNA-binding CsgD family transcriptional regulator
MRRRDRLVGRERELEELARIFAAAEAGEGRLLLLPGDAGVGKTRLVEEAISASGAAALRGVATERGSAPYAPVAAVLRDFLRAEPDALSASGPLGSHLCALLPELGPRPESSDRETLFAAICGAFETIARRHPTAVFLDDLQWADAATLEMLPSLAAAVEDWPLVVLGAYRSEDISRGHPLRRLRTDLRRAGRLAELVVEPLDAAASTALAAQVLGAEPGITLGAALYDRTQGVPFFVEELATALKDSSLLVSTGAGLELEPNATVPIPETVRDAVRLHAEGVSEAGRSSLEAAAAVGPRVELELLVALGEDAGIGELLERSLLAEVEPGIAAFRHDLAREALYADTPWPRRRSLHRALGELLEKRGAEPRLLAEHWLSAGDRTRARPLLLEAAGRFCEVHAYRDAAAVGRTALELWTEGEDEAARLEALDQLGRCAELSGELAEAARAWEEVVAGLAEPADLRRVAEMKQRLATVYQLQDARQKAVEAHIEAAESFAQCELHAEAAGEWLLASDGAFGDDPARVEVMLERALASARKAGRVDLESRCLGWQGFIASMSHGRVEEGLEITRQALSLALGGDHVHAALDAFWALGAIANAWNDYPSAQTALQDAVDLCRAHDMPEDEHFCLSCLAVVLLNRGDWRRAEAVAREVLASPAAPHAGKSHAYEVLGLLELLRGSTTRARPLLREALALARKSGQGGTEMMSSVGLALGKELEGTASGRWGELVRETPEALTSGYAQGLRWGATFAARRGERELVHACADALATYAARFASAETLAVLAQVLGEAALLEGEADRAVEQFTQAIDRLAEVDAPFDRAHAQLRAGVATAACGERDLAVERLVDAYRTFRKLGARPFWTEAAQELEALGERVDHRLGRRAARELDGPGLTRRELEVLRLVAVGRTNREIARELFLSPRTIDMHVRHMLAKLDCRSRTEATSRAHALGLLEATSAPS